MIVEMQIFSGRPNPWWRAIGEESAQILRRIAYDVLASAAPHPAALGYSGFLLRHFEPGEGHGRTSAIRVHGGVLAIATSGITSYCADVAGLESYLLQAARARNAIPAGVDLHR